MRLDERMFAAAAREIADRLRAALADLDAATIALDRDQALLTVGILDAVSEQLDRGAHKKLGPT